MSPESSPISMASFSPFIHIAKALAKRPHDDILITAIDAIILESGFVHLDNVSDFPIPLCSVHHCIHYTLPQQSNGAAFKNIVLKFHKIGDFLAIYGKIYYYETGIRCPAYKVQLNAAKLVHYLRTARLYPIIKISRLHLRASQFQVGEFWSYVKDHLATPLLIDVYEDAGLDYPFSFMGLADKLKLKVLGFMSGVELARMSSVCSSLRDLAYKETLWEQKYFEEISKEIKEPIGSYREAFAKAKETLPWGDGGDGEFEFEYD